MRNINIKKYAKDTTIHSPIGTLSVKGGTFGDETFTSELAGTFNLTRIRQWIKDTDLQPITVNMALETMERMLAQRDIDPVRLEELLVSPAQVMEPLVAVEMVHEERIISFLVDGHHRVAIFYNLGITKFRTYLVPADKVDQFKMAMLFNGEEIDPAQLLSITFGTHFDSDGNLRQT